MTKTKPKKLLFEKRIIIDPIYGGNFTFCIGEKESFKELLIKNKENKDWIDSILKIKIDGFSSGDYIWIEKPNLPVLVHELTHHSFTIFENKRIPLTRDTKEPHAYYMEFLFEECYKLIKQITIKQNNV